MLGVHYSVDSTEGLVLGETAEIRLLHQVRTIVLWGHCTGTAIHDAESLKSSGNHRSAPCTLRVFGVSKSLPNHYPTVCFFLSLCVSEGKLSSALSEPWIPYRKNRSTTPADQSKSHLPQKPNIEQWFLVRTEWATWSLTFVLGVLYIPGPLSTVSSCLLLLTPIRLAGAYVLPRREHLQVRSVYRRGRRAFLWWHFCRRR